jgi:hypothetical protein
VLWLRWHRLGEGDMVQVKLVLALIGSGLLLWYWLADDMPLLRRGRRVRDGLLVALGLISFYAWWNLGRYHFEQFRHYHELYHYVLGAKYAPELGYTRIYDCTVVAEAEYAHVGRYLARVPVRDLTNNVLTTGAVALEHPERCKEHFSPERWHAFEVDSDFFRRASAWNYWAEGLNDNGYNATPVWRLLAGPIAGLRPLDDWWLGALTWIDPVLLLLTMALIGWACGWREMCVAAIFFGTNYPARYWWTGGAFLRTDWLLATVASLAFMKRGRPFASGVAIAYATLLRIFPGFVAAALIVKIVAASVRARRLEITAAQRRFVLGAVVTVALLVPIATVYCGGVECWRGFAVNSAKHVSTPLTNNMGWRAVVAYSQSTRAAIDKNYRESDPFGQWKRHQIDNFQRRRVLYYGGLLAFLVLLGYAVSRHEDWVALSLGVGLVFMAAQLTSYYFVVFLAFATLWSKLPWSAWALTLLSAVSCWIPHWLDWDDQRYVAISVTYLVFVVAVTAGLARVSSAGPAPSPRTSGTGT